MASFYTQIPNRGQVIVSGDDAATFLQGLITNDITNATESALIYACMLTPQGKFLHDFFIRKSGESKILDCEGGNRAQDLHDRLLRFRLRAKVTLEMLNDISVWAVIGDTAVDNGYTDPRHTNMGQRIYANEPVAFAYLDFNAPNSWDAMRVSLTIPDGSRDFIVEKSTLAEANMDQLNAIDYKKGCYIGQELTARMHYRSLGKKHLKTVSIDELDQYSDVRSQAGGQAIVLARA